MSTPNMNLPTPVPTVTEGPEYAQANTECFEQVDAHDHTPGKGVPVPVAGMSFNDDMDIDGHRIQNAEMFQNQNLPAVKNTLADTNSFQVVAGEAWFVDGSGNAVQITSNGSIIPPPVVGLPIGVMMAYGGISAPSGWLVCDGSAVSRSTYANLFTAIGTTYGVGNGSTTFNLPNKSGRTSVGSGSYTDPVSGLVSRTQGTRLGAEKHVLTSTEMPSHTHVQNSHNHTQNAHNHTGTLAYDDVSGANMSIAQTAPGTNVDGNINLTIGSTTATNNSAVATNQSTGGDVAHNNMQPSEVDLWIIKT